MQDVKLIEPSLLYKELFLEFVEDVKNTRYESYELYTKSEEDFEEFVTYLTNSSKGINFQDGRVPCSCYWLVDDSDYLQMIGHIGYEIKSSLRKEGYGSKLLELGLTEARKIGLEKVLITCDEDNIGSIQLFKNSMVSTRSHLLTMSRVRTSYNIKYVQISSKIFSGYNY